MSIGNSERNLREWQHCISDLVRFGPGSSEETKALLANNDFYLLDLFSSSIQDKTIAFLENTYPATHQLIIADSNANQHWQSICTDFFRFNSVPSYQPLDVVRRFPEFIKRQAALPIQYPFIVDLAYYEFLNELLSCALDGTLPEKPVPMIPDITQFDNYIPIPNPVHYPFQSSFPIARIHNHILNGLPIESSYSSDTGQPHNFLLYRDPQALTCRTFVFDNALSATLYNLCDGRHSYSEVLAKLKDQEHLLANMPMRLIEEHAHQFFDNGLKQSIFLGSLLIV